MNIWQIMMTSFVHIYKKEISIVLAILCLGMVPAVVNAKMSPASTKPGYNCLCITKFDHGSVNWITGKVRAEGKASPSDKKKGESSDYILSAAKADASHHLALILKKIGFTAIENNADKKLFKKNDYHKKGYNKKISDAVSLRDTIMAGIETIAANAKISEQHYTSDRAMEVTIETSILGGFLQLVLPDAIREIPTIDFIGSNGTNNKEKKKKKKFTGLIINVKGLDFHPVIYPVIESEQGQDIYSSVLISREYAVQRGICAYACSMDEAVKSKRAGNNPIIIKALRKGGEDNSSIIISSFDAEKIEKATEHYAFMKKCKVVIVLD